MRRCEPEAADVRSSTQGEQGLFPIAALPGVVQAGDMLRLLILAAAWKLLREYVSRRRVRLTREYIVAVMKEKLRTLTKRATPQKLALANAAPVVPVPATATGPAVPPGAPLSSGSE